MQTAQVSNPIGGKYGCHDAPGRWNWPASVQPLVTELTFFPVAFMLIPGPIRTIHAITPSRVFLVYVIYVICRKVHAQQHNLFTSESSRKLLYTR